LSEPRVLAAKQRIRGTPLEDILSYRSADVNRVELPAGAYDLVIFEHALHHFSGLEPLLERVREALRPRGLLVANEFVGPTRFQWSDRQIEAANELLQRFPTRYRTAMLSELPRLPARRPSKLALWMSDPSEAVQSADILPLLRRHFEGLEVTGYGGAILHLLFAGIGHHFVDPDATAARLLEESFEREDALIANGEVAHDFAVAVGAK
ncbi:MAG: class I SAM-dependent methyltransferase, partial [Usitatibacter sp.]